MTDPTPTLPTRPTSRIVVLNARDEILLFQYHDGHTFWVTPGGGVEVGETYAEAAIRELHEETGLEVAAIGMPIWTRQKTVAGVLQLEQHFLLRVHTLEVWDENPDSVELNNTVSHRWWSLEELRSSKEPIYPESLAQHLEPILRGEIPMTPVEISSSKN